MLFQKKYLIGQEMVRRGLISQDDLDIALIEHEKQGVMLGKILVRFGFVSEDDLLSVLSDQLGLPICRLAEHDITADVLACVPAAVARKYKVVPVINEAACLTICMSDPLGSRNIEEIKNILKRDVIVVIDSDRHVLAAVKKYYGLMDADDLDFIGDDE